MNKIFSSLLIILLISACSSGPTRLLKKARDVQITNKARVSSCDLIGKVYGNDDSGNEEIAKIDLKNSAVEMEADTVVITETIQNGKIFVIHAFGYQCNQED